MSYIDCNVHFKSASNLIAADVNGKSDPYIKWTCGYRKGKSRVIKSNLNPVWRYTSASLVRVEPNVVLEVDIYDKDLVGSDDFLGHASIDISTLKAGEINNIPLTAKKGKTDKKKKNRGTINIEIEHFGEGTRRLGPTLNKEYCDKYLGALPIRERATVMRTFWDLYVKFALKDPNTKFPKGVDKTGVKNIMAEAKQDVNVVDEIMRVYDDSGDGIWQFEEFLNLIKDSLAILKDVKLGTRNFFKLGLFATTMDEDGDLDREKLVKLFPALVADSDKKDPEALAALIEEVVDEMIQQIDTDGSGTVDRSEFRQYIFEEDAKFQVLVQKLSACPEKKE
eukprot:TRINITY_DN2436_c0_g1_i1.p1 TRINITY_DN2436_c0_g1~~TRINITY_DN2436_c0_g1_i1.p1  ORF type:complete len:337 (-),score=120.76 TRINITY_DN2436_c0_g1_i1:124-1134(-)